MKKLTILILGIDGMVGRTVFKYLNENYSDIYGTSREKKGLYLSSKTVYKDLAKIHTKILKIDYVINCIGITSLSKDNKIEMIEANSLFPLKLAALSQEYKFRIIHISTDAVFSDLSGKVNEKRMGNPDTLYGMSKLLGESDSRNVLNIRTSVIGFSPKKKKGLIEFVKNNKKTIHGYSDQIWSGSTTLQYAKLCEYIIFKNKFVTLRKKTSAIHFAPLGPLTKFELISNISKATKKKTSLTKTLSKNTITRYLNSVYFDKNVLKSFGTQINPALEKLVEFENKLE